MIFYLIINIFKYKPLWKACVVVDVASLGAGCVVPGGNTEYTPYLPTPVINNYTYYYY